MRVRRQCWPLSCMPQAAVGTPLVRRAYCVKSTACPQKLRTRLAGWQRPAGSRYICCTLSKSKTSHSEHDSHTLWSAWHTCTRKETGAQASRSGRPRHNVTTFAGLRTAAHCARSSNMVPKPPHPCRTHSPRSVCQHRVHSGACHPGRPASSRCHFCSAGRRLAACTRRSAGRR